ncbi:MAG: DMT family transporter [Epulopiscium sp.]|mgnify:CR=1 FL=1|nr:DMT family transporter [Candidatus Epulonipiscium sp.]
MSSTKAKKLLTNPIFVACGAILCAILWGSAFPVLKLSYQETGLQPDDLYGKIVFAGMRFLLASSIILIVYKITTKESLRISRKFWLPLLLLGALQTGLQYFFFYNGLAHTTGMKGSIIESIGNFLTVLLAHFFYSDDRFNIKKFIGMATGFAGIIIVNWGQEFGWVFTLKGEGFLIICSILGAIATIMAKEFSGDLNPVLMTGWQMFLGSLMLLLFGVPNVKPGFMHFTPFAVGLLIYSALLSSVALSLWYALLKYNKAGEITLYRFIIPIAGAILSALFVPGEVFTVGIVISLILVAFGIILLNYPTKETKKTEV